MPKPVAKVPDPLEPYKDGRIWELTHEEVRAIPTFQPTKNANGELVGTRLIQWYVNGHHYLRFFDEQVFEDRPTDWPEYLAGWVD
jgi:hypothetical protein